jgi:hypothetical protein
MGKTVNLPYMLTYAMPVMRPPTLDVAEIDTALAGTIRCERYAVRLTPAGCRASNRPLCAGCPRRQS